MVVEVLTMHVLGSKELYFCTAMDGSDELQLYLRRCIYRETALEVRHLT